MRAQQLALQYNDAYQTAEWWARLLDVIQDIVSVVGPKQVAYDLAGFFEVRGCKESSARRAPASKGLVSCDSGGSAQSSLRGGEEATHLAHNQANAGSTPAPATNRRKAPSATMAPSSSAGGAESGDRARERVAPSALEIAQ